MSYANRKLISAGSNGEGSNIDDAYLAPWQRDLKAQWGSISSWAKRVVQAYRWYYPVFDERALLMQACKAGIQLDGMVGHWTAQQAVGFAKLGPLEHEAAYWHRLQADPARRAKARDKLSDGLALIGSQPCQGAVELAAIGEGMLARVS